MSAAQLSELQRRRSQKKIIITRNAKYVSLFLDESTRKKMQSRPVYYGLMVITEAFDWAMFFAGQTDTAGSESGETYTKQVLAVLKPYDVIEKMEETGVVVGTDRCSSIRSGPDYTGVKARGTVGTRFVARLGVHVSPRKVIAFHFALHMTSLTTGDAVMAVMPGAWLKHVRSMSTTFARSAKRKFSFCVAFDEVLAELDALTMAMGDVIQTHTWKKTLPKRYCAAWWTGLETTSDSIVLEWPPLDRMKQKLIEENYGPPRGDSDSESKPPQSDERQPHN